jgi:outer membrane protein TolC
MNLTFCFKPLAAWVFLLLAACTSLPTHQADRVDGSTLPKQWGELGSDLGSERDPQPTSLLDLVPVSSLKPLVELGLAQNPSLKQTAISLQRAGYLTQQRFGISYCPISTHPPRRLGIGQF